MNQIEFNPYVCDDDILKVCGEHGIVVQAYSPIGSGTKVGRRGETISGNKWLISLKHEYKDNLDFLFHSFG